MRLFLLVLCVLAAGRAHAVPDLTKAIQLDVEKYELSNGLTVLLHEDHAVPLVAYHQWFRVGSKDEDKGRTGLAHFFEHMMFKGTAKHPKEMFGSELASRGAEFNAFTNDDYTGYYIEIPKQHLQLVMDIESDRMRGLLLDTKDVVSEREVVKEERRMRYDNQPEGVIRETLNQMIFKNLPYQWPVIGSMEDLNQASMADLRAFYKRYYSPNNAVVVVAGDFDKEQVKAWIKKYYGDLPSEQIARKTYEAEWDQPKAQTKTIQKNVQAPIIANAYLTPPAADKDSYALDLLETVLGQGASSRLHKKLVYEDQIATSVSSGCHDELLASRCVINVYLKPGVPPSTVQKLIDMEIQMLQTKKISAKELEKAKNNYLMDYVSQLRKLNGRAEALAYNEIIFGDYKKLFNDIPAVEAVTAEEIQAVAQKYFKPQHRNVVILVPGKATKGKQESKDEPNI